MSRCLARIRRTDPEQGSLLLVYLVLTVVTAMSIITVATVLNGNRNTRHGEAFNQVLPHADLGVQAGLFALLNGAASTLPTSSSPTPITGTGYSGSWYATHPKTLEYDVTSTVTQNGVTRSVTAKLVDEPRFPLAAFADAGVTFRGSNAATSYNHVTDVQNTGNGDVGTNQTLTFNGNASADGTVLYNYAANGVATRCSGSPCAKLTTVASKLDITSTAATAFISTQIAACQTSGTLTAWVASANNGQLPAGVQCYSSMTFDQDTTVLGTDTNPTLVYVTGNVTVAGGGSNAVNVNIPASPALPDALALQIYTLGANVQLGNHSAVGAAIWAPHAACGGNPSNAQADVYGALVCGTISNQGGWTFHYDDALSSQGEGIWAAQHYQEN